MLKLEKQNTREYRIWRDIMNRVYNEKELKKRPTYIGCSVHLDWHSFQHFAEWFEKNYVENFEIDKDILFKGNKIYGPDTCCFVPKHINNLFTKSNKTRGLNPIGVTYNKAIKKFKSQICYNLGKQVLLGYYNTPEEAFQVYKIAKEKYIKEIANKYKGIITIECYNALMNYVVEITD